jgi:PAS domain S-box-containing protein
MLLMVPFDVIDSVPAISEYLETGKTEASRKKLQEALEENVARSKSIVDASVDAIIITNAQGIINVFNPASERLLKYTCSEIKGQSILTIIPPTIHENNPELQCYLNQLNTSQTPIKSREMIAVDKFGSQLPVHMSLSEGTISGKGFCAIFIRDITEIKASEKALLLEKAKTDKLLVSLLPK